MKLNNGLRGPQRLILALAFSFSNVLFAQTYSAQAQPVRPTAGWQPTIRSGNPTNSTDSTFKSAGPHKAADGERTSPTEGPAVQTAFYQAQGSLSDGLPQFPGTVVPSNAQLPLPDNSFNNGGGSGGMVSPPLYPPQEVSPPAQLPRGEIDARSANDPRGFPNSGIPNQTASRQSPVPQQAQQANRGGAPTQTAPSELRSPQVERVPNQQLQGSPPNQISPNRSGPNPPLQQSTLPAGQGIRPNAQLVTTGYPFVTPAPRGRFATSPYQPAVFQTPYQARPIPAQYASSNVPPAAARFVAAQQQYVSPQPSMVTPPPTEATAIVPPSQYLTPQQSALPQYQYPQPGMIPTAYQCTPSAPSVPSTGAVPGAYLPPTLPPNLTPGLYTPNNSGYTPLFSLGQENYNVQLGRGIIGQPTVYVPGQKIRNFIRYLSP